MSAHRYVEENSSAAKLATKKSAGVAPEVNLRGHVTCMLPQSTNKAAHSGLKRHQKSKTGLSVEVFTNPRNLQYWHYCHVCNPTHLQLPSLFTQYGISEFKIRCQ